MIPAILSCLFVLYLYRTLNTPDDATASATTGQSEDVAALKNRLTAIQLRLDQLTTDANSGDQT